MNLLTVELPDTIPSDEARRELALALFAAARISQGEAARLAGLTRESFISLLGSRKIPFTNIDMDDFKKEQDTWRELESRTARP